MHLNLLMEVLLLVEEHVQDYALEHVQTLVVDVQDHVVDVLDVVMDVVHVMVDV